MKFASFSKAEIYTLSFIAVLIGVGLLLPSIAQPEHYHAFADQRAWLGIPHFADVASNIIFTIAGLLGLLRLRHATPLWLVSKPMLGVFFFGLMMTGPGSAYYHWMPNTSTLFWDRLPMVIAFAGVIGTFLAQRISCRVGQIGCMVGLLMGGAGLASSVLTGNLALYLMLQFGGLLGIVAGLLLAKNSSDPLPWWQLIGWYVVAKALEMGDVLVWDLTGHLVSGHTLKHLAAGMAGVALLRLLTSPKAAPVLKFHRG
jgi:hypothetical protein